jgi:hypothetical protein
MPATSRRLATAGAETLPELGPPENRHRYHLALHELIGADNVDFAKAIADASQGGYDLESAAAALGFSPRPPAPRGQAHALQQCRQAVAAAPPSAGH